jgi:hypothetical protein
MRNGATQNWKKTKNSSISNASPIIAIHTVTQNFRALKITVQVDSILAAH